MTNSYNLNAHYTSNPKVEINQKMIVSAPNNLPARKHLFNDKDANNRMKMLNEDVYKSYKKEQQKDKTNFVKYFSVAVLAILAFLGIKKFL